MSEKAKDRDMCGLQSSPPCLGALLYVLNCFLLLLLQKETLGCPSVCRLCTGRQVNCRNLGLSSIPRSFPPRTVLLYLSGNNILHVAPSELTGLQKLAALYMDNCSISYVHPKAFVDLHKLCYLHLNNNNIKRLDPGIFEGLSSLRCLYLQNNQIAFVPRGLFSDLLSVRYLMLQRNRLSVLGSGTFSGMLSLQTLNLANNKISRISDSAFYHLEYLVHLYLEGNNLTVVPSNAIGMLKNLERLSLSHNPIGSIQPFAFKGLNKLRYLSLKGAKLKHIAVNGFFGLNNLSQLILSYNDLENISSSSFTLLHNLMYLQLDRNKITSIGDGTFANMGHSLKILSLAFNNITELQPGVLKPLVSLTHLQLNYNPWDCSCKMLAFHKWLASSSLSAKIQCQSPPHMRGRPLRYLHWAPFANCSSPTASPEETWKAGAAGGLHSTTALLLAWHKVDRHSTSEQFFRVGAGYVGSWEGATATSAKPLPYEKTTAENPSQATMTLSLLPAHVAEKTVAVNTTVQYESLSPSDATSVSLKPSLLCAQQVEKLNQAFDILLAFFIVACAVILFLTYKIIQFKQKLKVLENAGEKRIEYYGFYQPGRYSIPDPVQSLTQNSVGHSELDQIRLLKRTASESQAQVILFEHSAL
ncbi:leucine-rich repeat-containing protein 70 [Nothoprocta perdicaria]|uniref:leucine-rich repeat-containing protein 70 n=1 Tax=Nothoprocta perdicaria TaxID=30464 RepID=UPI000E1BA749|nr:leucine-rich repeat-containing protein 70 [Nothoprocta perdicaria]